MHLSNNTRSFEDSAQWEIFHAVTATGSWLQLLQFKMMLDKSCCADSLITKNPQRSDFKKPAIYGSDKIICLLSLGLS